MTEKLVNLRLFLILRNHAFLSLVLTRTPYHTCFLIKEKRNDLCGSCAVPGIKIKKRKDTQLTLRHVLATIIALHILSVCL